ncbi:MAG: hypothetical protein AAF236_05195 [Verrucomicrobiota bacterium]
MSQDLTSLQNDLAADPADWAKRRALVEALAAAGNQDSAVAVVNEGHAIPQEPGPWLDAAKSYAAVGAFEQAQSLTATALQIDPSFQPALDYSAQMTPAVAVVVEEEEAEVAVLADEEESAPAAAIAIPTGDDDPIALPQVSHSSAELDALHEAEEEVKRRREAGIRRDKINSVLVTLVIYVGIFALLIFWTTKIPPAVPPQIVASTLTEQPTDEMEQKKMERPTLKPTTAVSTASVDIVSASTVSNISLSSLDTPVSDVAVTQSMTFAPSMSMGMPSSSASKMMFGQPLEGDVLGVILDVSGSMAEYLPHVVREVDKNFKDSPIVYVRDVVIRPQGRPGDEEEVRLIVPEEVTSHYKDPSTGARYHSPYWFLWNDLPRKAPQRYVDRLIETFKTRPNQFLTVGRHNHSRVASAFNFLVEQKVDSIYLFSDFEDFVDEDYALEIGQMVGRKRIRVYIQPASKVTEFLGTMTTKIANRTRGRQLPPLTSIINSGDEETKLTSLLPEREEAPDMSKINVTLATPRAEMVQSDFYSTKPGKDWFEIHRLSEPEYDAVFYGPEARAHIYLKDANGQYIQNPISFRYHAWKEIEDAPDPRFRHRARKFLRLEEDPTFDGKEIVWRMVLEDDFKFRVHLYLDRKGMNATYVCDVLEDTPYQSNQIHFRIPRLSHEREDRYYAYDFPNTGLLLDEVRLAVSQNQVIFNLPRQDRDRFAKQWAQLGFEPGYNTRMYHELIRRIPNGIRDVKIEGPSFGPRVVHLRTTASKILLNGWSHRPDIEPWEGFSAALNRPLDRRERFTKTEGVAIMIE